MTSPLSKRSTLVLAVFCVLLGIPSLCMAANHYVCPGTAGAGTGTDWNNAYTAFGAGAGQINPGSMVRGDTYLRRGWNRCQFDQHAIRFHACADSGTSVITTSSSD